MATFDHPSHLFNRVAQPSLKRPGLEICQLTVVLAEKEQQLKDLNAQENAVGDIFYFVQDRPKNPWAVFGSYVFVSALLVASIVIPLFHTDPLPNREMVTRLFLPTPAAQGTDLKFQVRKPVSTTNSKSIVPVPVHKTEETPPAPVDTTAAVVGGAPGGVVGGVPGGVISDALSGPRIMPTLAKAPEPAPKRVRVASRVTEANLIHDVPPQYPPEAGRERIEGTVVLMAVIGKDGSVEEVQVVSGLPLLAHAAIEAVKQWRYKPYFLNGEPTEIDSRITINFTLSRG